jgi:hypothetical protein
MLKITDIDPNAKPLPNPDNLALLERQFDKAIRDAAEHHRWPAIVQNGRDTCTQAEVDIMVDRYRAAGWKVARGMQSERAAIDHPNRTPPTQ